MTVAEGVVLWGVYQFWGRIEYEYWDAYKAAVWWKLGVLEWPIPERWEIQPSNGKANFELELIILQRYFQCKQKVSHFQRNILVGWQNH